MKYRTNYRLATVSFGFGLISLLAAIQTFGAIVIEPTVPLFPKVFTIILFGGLVVGPLVIAFLKTKSFDVTADRLKTAYLFGLLPKEYNLKEVKAVKVIERLAFGSMRPKTINIDFNSGEKLSIDGRTLYHDDYIRLIKKIKRK